MTILQWHAAVLLLAILMDLLLGEPPNRFHPVVWMGTAIGWLRRLCPSNHWLVCLGWGAGLTLIGSGALILLGLGGEAMQKEAGESWWLLAPVLLLNAYLVKSCFGIRSLWRAADAVDEALSTSDLPEARRRLAWHLVSRDVDQLDESQVSAATIESVAENTSDSVIAPVFYFLLWGLPGALVYRYINTCDAMLGYRQGRLEWLGKVPARVDDVANLLPARLTTALMMLATMAPLQRLTVGLRVWWKDAGKTASPNAGHPMSAAAGLLGVRLEKAGHYVLGESLRAPGRQDIAAMNGLFRRTLMLAGTLSSLAIVAAGRLSA